MRADRQPCIFHAAYCTIYACTSRDNTNAWLSMSTPTTLVATGRPQPTSRQCIATIVLQRCAAGMHTVLAFTQPMLSYCTHANQVSETTLVPAQSALGAQCGNA